jgi:hypothetical protein
VQIRGQGWAVVKTSSLKIVLESKEALVRMKFYLAELMEYRRNSKSPTSRVNKFPQGRRIEQILHRDA